MMAVVDELDMSKSIRVMRYFLKIEDLIEFHHQNRIQFVGNKNFWNQTLEH
jgi:hypothetical protein